MGEFGGSGIRGRVVRMTLDVDEHGFLGCYGVTAVEWIINCWFICGPREKK